MRCRSLTFLALCGLLPGPLAAQQSALGWLPDNAVLVGQMDGWPKLRESLAKTRFGKMLESPEVAERMEPLLRQLREAMDKDAREGGAAKAIQDAMLGYGGRLTVGFGLDLSKVKGFDDESAIAEAAPWLLLALSPDGKTDFTALQKGFGDLADKAGDATATTELKWEGKTLRAAKLDGGLSMALPFVHAEHLVMVLGAPLEGALEACLNNKGKATADAEVRLAGSSLACWMNLESLMRGLKAAMESSAGPAEAGMVGTMLEAFGFLALQSLSVKLGDAGEHVVFDMDLTMGDGQRGFLGAFFDVAPGQPKLLDLVPLQRPAWQVSKLSFGKIYEAIGKVVETVAEPMFGMSRAHLEEQFTEHFKVRLKEDLIAHLGDEYLNVSGDLAAKPKQGTDADPSARREMDGECYAVSLANAKAFGESLEKVMRSQGLHEGRKTEDYKGVSVHRLEVMDGFEVHYAVSERVAIIGLGNRGAENVRAILDLEAEARTGTVRPLPVEMTERLEHAPRGWQDVGSIGVGWIVDVFRTAFLSEIDPDDSGMAAIAKEMDKTIDLIQQVVSKFKLDTMLAVARASGDRMVMRMIW